MRVRVVVACAALLVLMASGAFAQDVTDPSYYSFDRSDFQIWPNPFIDGAVVKVTEEVDKGNVGTPAEGLWKYSYSVWNNGTVGIGSPITIFGFMETLDGGPIVAEGNFQGWTYTGTPLRPEWSVNGADPIPIMGIGNFFFVSAGPPDRYYSAFAHDTEVDRTMYGETTGPTPEPCTLALIWLGLSGAGVIRLLKCRRE